MRIRKRYIGALLCIIVVILACIQSAWIDTETQTHDFDFLNVDSFFQDWRTIYPPYQQKLELWINDTDLILENNGTKPWSEGYSVVLRSFNVSHIHDWKIEARVKWVDSSWGGGTIWAATNDFVYQFSLDDLNTEKAYVLSISKNDPLVLEKVLVNFGYSDVKNTWNTFRLERTGNTFKMHFDNVQVGTYNFGKDPNDLVEIGLGTGWDSTLRYDYVSVEYRVESTTTNRYLIGIPLSVASFGLVLYSVYCFRTVEEQTKQSKCKRIVLLASYFGSAILATLTLTGPVLVPLLPSDYQTVTWALSLILGSIGGALVGKEFAR